MKISAQLGSLRVQGPPLGSNPAMQKARLPSGASFLAESVGFDLRCGAGHLGLKRAAGTFPSALGFESLMQKAKLPCGSLAFWRRVWDSNPRGREPKRFSRPPRYDHFDNSPNIQFGLVKRAHLKCALFMAQKEGFEPSRAFDTPTPLAGEPLRPLGYFCTLPLKYNSTTQRLCQEIYSPICRYIEAPYILRQHPLKPLI